MNSKANSEGGYTVVELLVTVAIIGLLSTLALPSINNVILRYRLKDTAREIASSLRLLRIRAISTNFRTYLDFNPGASLEDRFYTAFVDEDNMSDHDAPVETEATNLLFRDALGTYKGTRLPTGIRFGWGGCATPPCSAVTFSGNRAGFNPDGMPNTSGTVYLTNTLNDSYRVIVATITGRVKIEKWNGSSWE
ncbi:GspH/FimT family pseudopilin [Nitrospira defluvii]|nr:GspH/FimT family pseudopilin [Nitrospira defluvii]